MNRASANKPSESAENRFSGIEVFFVIISFIILTATLALIVLGFDSEAPEWVQPFLYTSVRESK